MSCMIMIVSLRECVIVYYARDSFHSFAHVTSVSSPYGLNLFRGERFASVCVDKSVV